MNYYTKESYNSKHCTENVQTAEADTVGHIVAVGDEAEAEGLKVGDKIYFGTLAKDYKDEYLKYHEFKDNDEKFLVLSWQDVCFVEEPDESPESV